MITKNISINKRITKSYKLKNRIHRWVWRKINGHQDNNMTIAFTIGGQYGTNIRGKRVK